jgi:hypothetical protein
MAAKAPHCPRQLGFQMFPPEVATVKSDQKSFLPVDGLISFHSECATAISLVSCKTVNGDFPVPAFGILPVFKKLTDREKRPCLSIPSSTLTLCRALRRPHPDKSSHPCFQIKCSTIWRSLQGTRFSRQLEIAFAFQKSFPALTSQVNLSVRKYLQDKKM